jgi:hypothetical protein
VIQFPNVSLVVLTIRLFQMRAFWYLAMSLIQGNDDLQRNGYVFVAYSVGSSVFGNIHLELSLKNSFMSKCLPFKARGFHFCYDDVRLCPLMAAMQISLGQFIRVRFRSYCGK